MSFFIVLGPLRFAVRKGSPVPSSKWATWLQYLPWETKRSVGCIFQTIAKLCLLQIEQNT